MSAPSKGEVTVLRRLVDAQDKMLVAYRLGTRTPSKAIDEALRCRRWLAEIDAQRNAAPQ